MRLAACLDAVAEAPRPEDLSAVGEHLPQQWIQEALEATGTATMRRRRLPAEQVVWLVLGMALFRNRSIVEIVDKLDLALPVARGDVVAKSAVPQARARLGPEPLAWLFERSGRKWAHESARRSQWRGLALYAVDGTLLRVPDTAKNREHYGVAEGLRGPSGYPMVRVVCLMAVRSHLLAAARFGPYRQAEQIMASEMWPEIPDHSLTILDRNFVSPLRLLPIETGGSRRHWLTRAKSRLKWTVVERFGPGDFLVEMKTSADALEKNPSLPATWTARAIEYQRKGFPPQTLLTSLRDPAAFPASEVVALYHDRWEIELGYDELKTEVLDREEAIRSKSPNAVAQELWGILLAYNLVRVEMERVADEAGVEPTRISFITAYHLICDEWLWSAVASPGSIPRHLRDLRANLARLVLPPRRERSYPRGVKVKLSPYAVKRRPN
jgi:hypothetical protein